MLQAAVWDLVRFNEGRIRRASHDRRGAPRRAHLATDLALGQAGVPSPSVEPGDGSDVSYEGARATKLSVKNVSDQVGVRALLVLDQAEQIIDLGRCLVGGKSLFEGSASRSRGATLAKRVPHFFNPTVH